MMPARPFSSDAQRDEGRSETRIEGRWHQQLAVQSCCSLPPPHLARKLGTMHTLRPDTARTSRLARSMVDRSQDNEQQRPEPIERGCPERRLRVGASRHLEDSTDRSPTARVAVDARPGSQPHGCRGNPTEHPERKWRSGSDAAAVIVWFESEPHPRPVGESERRHSDQQRYGARGVVARGAGKPPEENACGCDEEEGSKRQRADDEPDPEHGVQQDHL